MNRAFACMLMFSASLLYGCEKRDQNEMQVMTMRKQFRYETQGSSEFFPDKMAARQRVPGTVSTLDFPTTRPALSLDLLHRGQERFDIYCSMCHGTDGFGNGVVVQRGFPEPPTFHSDRLRALPDEYLEQVISNGRGKMPPYADQISYDDRWAIVAYVRALQCSQHAALADVPAELSASLKEAATP